MSTIVSRCARPVEHFVQRRDASVQRTRARTRRPRRAACSSASVWSCTSPWPLVVRSTRLVVDHRQRAVARSGGRPARSSRRRARDRARTRPWCFRDSGPSRRDGRSPRRARAPGADAVGATGVQWVPESYDWIVAVNRYATTFQTAPAAHLARRAVSRLAAPGVPAHPQPVVHGRRDGADPGRRRAGCWSSSTPIAARCRGACPAAGSSTPRVPRPGWCAKCSRRRVCACASTRCWRPSSGAISQLDLLFSCTVESGSYQSSDETGQHRWLLPDQLPELLPNQIALLRKAGLFRVESQSARTIASGPLRRDGPAPACPRPPRRSEPS